MSRRNIGLVYRKELRDLLRDRRTIVSMIVMPVVVMPLLMTVLGLSAVKLGGKVRQEIPKVMVLGGEDSTNTLAALRALNAFAFVPPSQDFTNLISDKKISAAIAIPTNFDAAVQAGEAAAVTIYTYEGEFKSTIAAQSLDQFFRSRRDHIVRERLADRHLPEKLLAPFEIRQTNVASPQKVSGNLIGMILPYLVIIMCMTGAIYPSVDLTAGEKERGTMETLLCSPVARTHLVLGKGLVVLTVSLVTACLSLVSNGAALMLLKDLMGNSAKGNALPLTTGSLGPARRHGDDAAAGHFLFRRHAGHRLVFPQRQGGQLLSPAAAHLHDHSGSGAGPARHGTQLWAGPGAGLERQFGRARDHVRPVSLEPHCPGVRFHVPLRRPGRGPGRRPLQARRCPVPHLIRICVCS